MSKVIRTQKPSVLPWYAAALVFAVLCAALPAYKLWALLLALGGAAVMFGAARRSARPGWWSMKCLSTPAAAMWTRCWPTSSRSWMPSTR